MTLNEIADGQSIIIDANIFVYHFTGISKECSNFLWRCEAGLLNAFTTVGVAMEVLHRLMMIEAVSKGLVSPGNVAKKLKEKPDLVKKLSDYARYGLCIPEMGIQIVPYIFTDCTHSQQYRKKYGLLTNDSLLLSTMTKLHCFNLATADEDFLKVEEITVFRPGDI